MVVRSVRIPHSYSGWFSLVRGEIVTRKKALMILIFGPTRARIEHEQSNDPDLWKTWMR